MLKKIRVDQLQIGMYIHALCGPWLSHDFWRTSFLLEKQDVLDKLRANPVEEVWIDIRRGLDVPPETLPAALTAFTHDTQPTTLIQERQRAFAMCRAASTAVMDMFREARMGKALNTDDVNKFVNAVHSSVERHPEAFVNVARLKTADNYTYMHSVAVCGLMVALARKLDLDHQQVIQAGKAGLLHDMGKIHSDPDILNKPGALTADEFTHMKQHPVKGYLLLRASVQDEDVLDACLHHHERMDGKGYPHGLAGADLRLLTRMTAICDVYDAITSDRSYKKGWPPSVALQRMAQWCGTHLDGDIFQAFITTIGMYPVGSLVRLNTGLLGVVCASAQDNMTSPTVAAFYHIQDQRMLRPAQLIDLTKRPHEHIVSSEDPKQWPFKNIESLLQNSAATALAMP